MIFKFFGDWQGTWLAKVDYKGKVGWVVGSYGSCSGCDAFEADFGSKVCHDCLKEEYHNPICDGFVDGCKKCNKIKKSLVSFGKGYLETILTQEEAEKRTSKDLDWDMEASDMSKFVKENREL